jgi:nucleoside-diphosphate-sugar epimerase
MNVFLTGAFGNVGRSTIAALLERGHSVRAFDLPTPANRKAASRFRGRIETTWGDLRSQADLNAALGSDVAFGSDDAQSSDVAFGSVAQRSSTEIDAVLHLGFVIPSLSVTGVNSEDRPDFARSVNVGGTRNLIEALRGLPHKPRLVFASSFHIYGKTQHLLPPRTSADEPHPVEHYARHKLEAESLVRGSGLEWAILRLAAALPIQLILDRAMFDVPLDNRIEFIHTRDAGQAFAAAADHPRVPGKVLLIGGGPHCQLIYREMMAQVLEATGIGSLPECYFSREPFATDWLDTSESQALFHYQQRTFADYTRDLRRILGPLRWGVIALRPVIHRWLISRSRYGEKEARMGVRRQKRASTAHIR